MRQINYVHVRKFGSTDVLAVPAQWREYLLPLTSQSVTGERVARLEYWNMLANIAGSFVVKH